MGREIVFIDLEVGVADQRILDFGAVKDYSRILHTKSKADLSAFVSGADYVCGHNIINHDLIYCGELIKGRAYLPIDTLYMSPLLFPTKPYHNLVKDDKLQTDQLNNPANDAKKAMELFYKSNTYMLMSKGISDFHCLSDAYLVEEIMLEQKN